MYTALTIFVTIKYAVNSLLTVVLVLLPAQYCIRHSEVDAIIDVKFEINKVKPGTPLWCKHRKNAYTCIVYAYRLVYLIPHQASVIIFADNLT